MDYDLNDYDDPAPWNDHSMANSPAAVVAQGLQADGICPGKKTCRWFTILRARIHRVFGRLQLSPAART